MSPRRKRKDSESGGMAPGVEAGGAAGAPEVPELPENVEYMPEDKLHGKVVVTLKEKANKMFEEAAEDPNSEANQLVRILLLNQLANMQPESYQENPKMVVTEERYRGVEAERRAEMDKHMLTLLKRREVKLKEEIKLARTRTKELAQKVKAHEHKLAEAERLAQNAQAAAEHGAPLDPVSVYTKIAQIIGLESPAEQTRASGLADA
jgi:hypothetical protein